MTKAVIDANSRYQYSVVDEYEPLLGENVVPFAPLNAADIWNGSSWITAAPTVTTLINAVQVEAEKRIDAGTVINGIQFKGDNRSINRLNGMITLAELKETVNEPVLFTFRTSTGVELVVTSAAQAKAIFKVSGEYLAAVLKASSILQGSIIEMSEADRTVLDITASEYWP